MRYHTICCVLTQFAGHRNSYEKHVLHRDISLGNILITDKLQGSGHRGVLIDYDNAVKIPHKQHVTDDPLSVGILLAMVL